MTTNHIRKSLGTVTASLTSLIEGKAHMTDTDQRPALDNILDDLATLLPHVTGSATVQSVKTLIYKVMALLRADDNRTRPTS